MTRAVLLASDLSTENIVALLRSKTECGAHLQADSRAVRAGDVFLASPGLTSDGRHFIASAIEQGASAVLMHADLVAPWQANDFSVPVLGLPDLTGRLGAIADLWYDKPSAHLKVIAVTGTNGKTSCVQWLTDALQSAGYSAGALGTLGVRFPDGSVRTGALTTPEVISMH